jgi:hypothetical protein
MQTATGTRAKKIGRLLAEDGAMRESQIPRILAFQERDRRAGLDSRFGELCVRSGWVETGKVAHALELQGNERAAMHTTRTKPTPPVSPRNRRPRS